MKSGECVFPLTDIFRADTRRSFWKTDDVLGFAAFLTSVEFKDE